MSTEQRSAERELINRERALQRNAHNESVHLILCGAGERKTSACLWEIFAA